MTGSPRVVVVLPAYNAARTLERTVVEIPTGAVDALLLVDDASRDETVAIAERLGIPTRVHPLNRGYGANQKTCYGTALEMGADIVVMLHPDYQYDPVLIPEMVERLRRGDCDMVLGSRMLERGAREGGMPWWKRLGNRVLSRTQNILLGSRLSEFHSGYRAFTRQALERSGFERFEDGFVFDAQMLVSLVYRGQRIEEIACPARYLPEASSIDFWGSVRYGLGCLAVALRYRLNRWGLVPAGWLGGEAPAPLRPGAPIGLLILAAAWFLLSRLTGVDVWAPVRLYDSYGYSDPTGLRSLVSFSGEAPRAWPIPWFYARFADDGSRVLAQMVLGASAWMGLAAAVGTVVRHRRVAILGALGVLVLGLTAQATSWDGLIMPESIGLTLSVAAVALTVRLWWKPSWATSGALGVVAGVLTLARAATAPVVVLLGLALVGRGIRRRVPAMIAAVVPIVACLVWLALLLPRQDVAYGRFENRVRGAASAPYGSDTWASVLYGRLLDDPATRRWLSGLGAPPLAVDMELPRFREDKDRWGLFRATYAEDTDWQAWFERQGGQWLYVRGVFAEPATHLRLLARDLPYLLESPWPEEAFPEYGPPAPAPFVSRGLFFRSWSGIPVDLLAIAFVLVAATARARSRGVWTGPSLFTLGLGVAGASLLQILIGWSLAGIELVRHSVPGPLGLRVGLLLAVVGILDSLLGSSGDAVGP